MKLGKETFPIPEIDGLKLDNDLLCPSDPPKTETAIHNIRYELVESNDEQAPNSEDQISDIEDEENEDEEISMSMTEKPDINMTTREIDLGLHCFDTEGLQEDLTIENLDGIIAAEEGDELRAGPSTAKKRRTLPSAEGSCLQDEDEGEDDPLHETQSITASDGAVSDDSLDYNETVVPRRTLRQLFGRLKEDEDYNLNAMLANGGSSAEETEDDAWAQKSSVRGKGKRKKRSIYHGPMKSFFAGEAEAGGGECLSSDEESEDGSFRPKRSAKGKGLAKKNCNLRAEPAVDQTNLAQLDGACEESPDYQCPPYDPADDSEIYDVDLSDLSEVELCLFNKHSNPYCSCETRQSAATRVLNGIKQHRDYNKDEVDPKMRNGVIKRMLLFLLRNFKNAVVLAHYGSRFDFIAVVEEALHGLVDFKVIQNGRKMLRVKVQDRNITFLDFYNYTNQSLNKVCSSLLNDEQKDIFPHAMNRPWFYHLKLNHLPYIHDYEPFMKSKVAQEELQQWHEANYATKFVLHDIADEYCLKDTVLLQKCALEYTKTCLKAESCLAKEMSPSPRFQAAKAALWVAKTESEMESEASVYEDKMTILETFKEHLDQGLISMNQVPEAAQKYVKVLQESKKQLEKVVKKEIFGPSQTEKKIYPHFILPFTSKGCTVSTYANVLFRKYSVAANPRIPLCLNESTSVGARASSQQERIYMAYRTKLQPGLQSVLTGPQKTVECDSHNFLVDGFIPDK